MNQYKRNTIMKPLTSDNSALKPHTGLRILLLVMLASLTACSSSGSSDDESSTTGNGVTDSGTADSGTADSGTADSGTADSGTTAGVILEPKLVPSSALPTTNANGSVAWGFDATPSGLEVHIQPYLELPLASNGSPARWNSMSSFDDRHFVADEQDGRVYEITNRTATLWFDIAASIQTQTGRTLNTDNLFHGGVRGIAFHPDFKSNGKFYASLMEQRPVDRTSHLYISDQSGLDADSVLVEWTADTSTLTINPGSYREVFRVGVPEYDHPIKQILFNTNLQPSDGDYGNLYIAHGDGSVASTLAGTGHANDALGKILRINPLQNGDQNYSIPADNPFLNDSSLPDEVYSYGHRNPHHLAFSDAGHLLATEAGRDNVDEVNLITRGADYGWAEREGAYTHLDVGTLVNGISAIPDDDTLQGYVYPVIQFGHHGAAGATFTGEALGGGFVVENGSPLNGEFFYIDFPKTALLFHSSMSDILQANTAGVSSELSNARSFIATVKFDHDSNPDTPALDIDLYQSVKSASGFVDTNNRTDIRIHQGSKGELYMTSKRNNMVYLVTSSLPNGLNDPAGRAP